MRIVTFDSDMQEIKIIGVPKNYTVSVEKNIITLHENVVDKEDIVELPTSWEDLKSVGGEYICADSMIKSTASGLNTYSNNRNIIPRGYGKAILALIQLLQLRDRVWELTDSRPIPEKSYYFISMGLAGELDVYTGVAVSYKAFPLSFASKKIAKQFLKYHSALILESILY